MMNTLHKSLTIAFLAASIFISGLTVDFVGALWIGTWTEGLNQFDRSLTPRQATGNSLAFCGSNPVLNHQFFQMILCLGIRKQW